VSVLVDTNGGTDWSAAEETVATKTGNDSGTDPNSDTFTTFSGDIEATGTSITIFLDVEMDDVASGHDGAFDNLTIKGCAADPPPVQNAGFEDGFTSGLGDDWTSYLQSGATSIVLSEGTSSPAEGDSYQIIEINLPSGAQRKATPTRSSK